MPQKVSKEDKRCTYCGRMIRAGDPYWEQEEYLPQGPAVTVNGCYGCWQLKEIRRTLGDILR